MVGGSQHEQALGECWGLLHTRQHPWRTEGDAGGARSGLVTWPSCGNLYVSCEGAELDGKGSAMVQRLGGQQEPCCGSGRAMALPEPRWGPQGTARLEDHSRRHFQRVWWHRMQVKDGDAIHQDEGHLRRRNGFGGRRRRWQMILT